MTDLNNAFQSLKDIVEKMVDSFGWFFNSLFPYANKGREKYQRRYAHRAIMLAKRAKNGSRAGRRVRRIV